MYGTIKETMQPKYCPKLSRYHTDLNKAQGEPKQEIARLCGPPKLKRNRPSEAVQQNASTCPTSYTRGCLSKQNKTCIGNK